MHKKIESCKKINISNPNAINIVLSALLLKLFKSQKKRTIIETGNGTKNRNKKRKIMKHD